MNDVLQFQEVRGHLSAVTEEVIKMKDQPGILVGEARQQEKRGICNMGLAGSFFGYTWHNNMTWTVRDGNLRLFSAADGTTRTINIKSTIVTTNPKNRSVELVTASGGKVKLTFLWEEDFNNMRNAVQD